MSNWLRIAPEVRDARVKLLRFAAPEPARSIGLAWRYTSPRKRDFAALGKLVVDTLKRPHCRPALQAAK